MWNHFHFDVALYHTERNLVRNEMYRLFRLFHLRDIIVAHADMSYLTLPDEFRNGFESFSDGCFCIRPMDLVQVDVICAESAQAVLAFADNALRSGLAVDVEILSVVAFAFESEITFRGIKIPAHSKFRQYLNS